MRIALIEPGPPGFHIYSFIKQIRLGLPLLGALARARGHELHIDAENLSEIDWDDVLGSDLVGISTITSTAIKAYRYATRVQEAGIPVVMGGPHVTFEADEALEFCDYVVRGEGEDTLLELLEVLQGRRDPDTILGLSYHGRGGQHHNPPRPQRASLDDLPAPDLSLVERHDRIHPTPFVSSRGCQYDCEFCCVILMFGRRVRTVGPEKVIADLRALKPEGIFFYDDNFVISKRSTKALLARMIREELNVPFSAQIRVDAVCKDGRVDHELLRLLREAGCEYVYLGLESANPKTLAAFNKHQSVSDMAGGLAALNEYEIGTHGMFVFGADDDTPESLGETADFAIERGLSSVQFLILTPLPGTRQYRMLRESGRIFTNNWSLYDGHHVVYWPKRMSPLELQEAAFEAHQRFYRLSRIGTYPRYRGMGFLITHGWPRVPDNRAYLRELRAFTATERPPFVTGDGAPASVADQVDARC